MNIKRASQLLLQVKGKAKRKVTTLFLFCFIILVLFSLFLKIYGKYYTSPPWIIGYWVHSL